MGSWSAEKFRSRIEELDLHALAGDALLDVTVGAWRYCSGGWDEATRERWRREAPMVRR